jgi:hypothetical protein
MDGCLIDISKMRDAALRWTMSNKCVHNDIPYDFKYKVSRLLLVGYAR